MTVSLFYVLWCGACDVACDEPFGGLSDEDLSRQILDDRLPADKRRALAEQSAGRAAGVIAAMVADLRPGDEREEYRRIPWIWRVAIAAGKRNEKEPLTALLEATLPQEGQKLRDWQAVAIGGGIINGISLKGQWPKPRLEELIGQDATRQRRWQQAIAAASAMADDVKVKAGTRYDALRMIALDPTEEHVWQLARYLVAKTNEELQMGAVSGLGDIDLPVAPRLLADAIPGLAAENRALAIDGLLRSEDRAEVLLGLLEGGKVEAKSLADTQRQRLRALPPGKVRDRAAALLQGIE
jgi:hypothetical protein